MTHTFSDTIPGTTVSRGLNRDDLIVIAGAGGFIAGSLTRYFSEQGYTNIRAIDRKPLPDWYLRVPGVESISMDLSNEQNAIDAVKGAVEVYNLAADMGGMGFIENFRVECLRSILVNTHLTEAVLPRRRLPLLLLLVGLRLQHGPPEDARGDRAQGVGRLPGDGRARLRLGEADLRDVLRGVLGGARSRDPHRPLPQHLRPQRHLVRRSREGAGGDDAARCSRPRTAATCGSRSGATAPRRGRFCYIDDCVHGIDLIMHTRRADRHPDQPRLERAGLDQRAGLDRRGDRRRQARALVQARRAQGRGRPQQRQHVHPAGPGLGAQHAAPRRHGRDLRLDRRAVRRPQGRQARRRGLTTMTGPAAAASPAVRRRPPPPSGRRSGPCPTGSRWRAAGSTSRGCRRSTRSRPAPWWWSRSGPPSATWTAAGWRPGRGPPRRRCGATPSRSTGHRPASSASCTRPRTPTSSSRPGRRTCAGSIYPGISRLDYDAIRRRWLVPVPR